MLAQAPSSHDHLSMTSPIIYLLSVKTVTATNTRTKYWQDSKVCTWLICDFCPTSTSKWQQGTITATCGELTYEVDCEGHQQHVDVDHLLSALISSTPVSEPLTVADTQLDEASNQNEPLDVAMLSLPMVDTQLSSDLPSDFVSLPGMSVPAPTCRSSCVHNKPQCLANWGTIIFCYCIIIKYHHVM